MFRSSYTPLRWLSACGVGLFVGCAGQRVIVPPGFMPTQTEPIDLLSATELNRGRSTGPRPLPAETAPLPRPIADNEKPEKEKAELPFRNPENAGLLGQGEPPRNDREPFRLSSGLPGSATPLLKPLQLEKNASLADREKAVLAAYPELVPVARPVFPKDKEPLSLANLEQIAMESSPVVQKANIDVEVAFNKALQAGLYPNPTVGYQADQWQPGLKIPNLPNANQGQQGLFINQLIKTVGKVRLAQLVSGFDYINAMVAVRKAHVSVAAQVRGAYFQVIVAEKTLEVNKALADMTDQVYRLQLRQVIAGVAAGYEPLQLYAQAIQARNAFAQAEASYNAAWKKLSAALGRPDMEPTPLIGQADAPVPKFEQALARARILDQHTDLLTVRNTIAQNETNLTLQKRIPIPDLQTNTYQQYDTLAQQYQFGVQVGVAIPIADRNQGNVRAVQAQIASAKQQLFATENDLFGQLGEAFGRYEAYSVQAENYRTKILPTFEQAYQLIVRRFQVEPDKVSFNDIVVAQQNLSQALQTYLSFLDGQWKAVVDVANLSQYDELYFQPTPHGEPVPNEP